MAVEFYDEYTNFKNLKFDVRINGHGAVYGSSDSGKSTAITKMCLSGMFSHCKTIIFVNGRSSSQLSKSFIDTMMKRWQTLVFNYRVSSEEELNATINKIEKSLLAHRKNEYKRIGISNPPDHVDMRPGMEFGNAKIIIDDLHKEVVKSAAITRHFQSIRHSGIELIFVTQSFKNINSHDQIKENLSWVLLFMTTQNRKTLRAFLADGSRHRQERMVSAPKDGISCKSSLEFIYNNIVQLGKKFWDSTATKLGICLFVCPNEGRKKYVT